MMTTNPPRFLNRSLILFALIFCASACAPQAASTPFRPPTQPPPTLPLATVTPLPGLFTPLPPTVTPTETPLGPCTNNLAFLNDVTIPDETLVTPSASINKQWLVQNSGSCDWDAEYRLKWIGGDTLGANVEQPLYPARAGSETTLQIVFAAPAEFGSYESAWQAVDPNGNVFGDLIFIKIVVGE